MAADKNEEVAQLLVLIRGGDEVAKNRLIGLLHNDLLRRAAEIPGVQAGNSLSPSRVVQEVLLRYLVAGQFPTEDRTHFLNAMKLAMRQVVIDYWREKAAKKRQAKGHRVPLEALLDTLADKRATADADLAPRLGKLDTCLEQLRAIDENAFIAVVCFYFLRLHVNDIADTLVRGVSTIEKDLRHGRTFLRDCVGDAGQ